MWYEGRNEERSKAVVMGLEDEVQASRSMGTSYREGEVRAREEGRTEGRI